MPQQRRKLSRLARNIRKGDRWTLRDMTGDRPVVFTVEAVADATPTGRFHFSGKRRYDVPVRVVITSLPSRPLPGSEVFSFDPTDRLDITR